MTDDTPRLPRPLAEPAVHTLTAVALLLIGLQALSVLRYAPPAPRSADAPPELFSAGRALETMARLLGDGRPHPVGSEANLRVAERLVSELQALGLEPRVQEVFQASQRYSSFAWVRNVMARIEGAQRGDAVLLLAHYDSREAAPGAGDDLAGVTAILEVARILLREGRPERDVILLFSDGEEGGLIGAEAFIAKHPWFEDVGVVLNLEGRGNDGPSLMFETGRDDASLVRRWAGASTRPFGGSLFVTVYEHMPNNTDFTPFKEAGLRGLNFAFIGRVEHYHTAHDDLAHLNPGSVQHHGEHLLGLARDLAFGPPLEASGDAVFFDVHGAFVVGWPAGASVPLALLALALVLYPARVLARPGTRGAHPLWPGRLRAIDVVWGLAALGAALTASALVVGGAGGAVQRLSGASTPFSAEPTPHLITLWLAGALTLAVVCLRLWRTTFWGSFVATWGVWALLSLVLSLTLTGGCYLLLLPALAAGAAATLQVRLGAESSPGWSTATALVPILVAGLIWLPMIHGLPVALGLGPRSPTGYVICMFLTALVPLLARREVLLPAPVLGALVLAAGAAFAVAVTRPVHTPEHPRRMNVGFFQDNAKGEARLLLLTPGEQLPESLGAKLDVAFEGPQRPFPGARIPAFHAPAQPLALASPELANLQVEPIRGGRRATFSLRSRRGAREVALLVPREAKLKDALIGGEEVERIRRGRYAVFWCNSLPPGGVMVRLTFSGTEPVEVVVIDASDGDLPPAADPVVRAREPDGVSSYKGDQVIVLDRVRF